MKAYLSEVHRLMICVTPEEQSHVVSGIRMQLSRIFMRNKFDIRILLMICSQKQASG